MCDDKLVGRVAHLENEINNMKRDWTVMLRMAKEDLERKIVYGREQNDNKRNAQN